MRSYSNSNHIIPESSVAAPFTHFSWFYPGGFHSAPKTSSCPSQGTQTDPQPEICSISATELAKINDPGSKPIKIRKQKPSVKCSNRILSKALKPKQPRKSSPKKTKGPSLPEAKREKKNLSIDIDRTNFDLSGVPSPFCSCTGMPRICYKWGAGGWQSSCCTINISKYPLPMRSTRPGFRTAGRKMSNGAYVKLLLKLTAEGHDLSHPLDMKDHWARHGTNKFVTIK